MAQHKNHYISTRGGANPLIFSDVLIEGMARDGGLYVPENMPALSPDLIASFEDKNYQDIAFDVMRPFIDDGFSDDELKDIIEKAYASFHDEDITPLHQLNEKSYVLELFHGPTLAFKDVALQLLGHLFDHVLKKKNKHLTVLGATSGDTGSAAIEGCKHSSHLDIYILHPHGRVSDVQRRQMTSVISPNVHNVAVEGNFDDCQALVKAAFADHEFRDAHGLTAINSINWARIMAQITYYFFACSRLDDETPLHVIVPSGNFGNIFAAYCAKQMGANIGDLIAATNSNDALYRFIKQGEMHPQEVHPTLSPSMDIQVPSNFERLIYMALGDTARVNEAYKHLKENGSFGFSRDEWQKIVSGFDAYRADDTAIAATIKDIYKRHDYVVDPHTATGLFAMQERQKTDKNGVYVALGCAHPAKFPDAVFAACGVRPELPDFLSDLMEKPEKVTLVKNDMNEIKKIIEERS